MPVAIYLQNDIALNVSPHFQNECPVSGAKKMNVTLDMFYYIGCSYHASF